MIGHFAIAGASSVLILSGEDSGTLGRKSAGPLVVLSCRFSGDTGRVPWDERKVIGEYLRE